MSFYDGKFVKTDEKTIKKKQKKNKKQKNKKKQMR